ncbi:hypothetical protein [Actinosynnema sp. NPDC020468]|uniref:hypothetical protein n=1 Tax=Actinosynnema sp. NPDC020468 TaxID=3154488 RepID=UPI0034010ACF
MAPHTVEPVTAPDRLHPREHVDPRRRTTRGGPVRTRGAHPAAAPTTPPDEREPAPPAKHGTTPR